MMLRSRVERLERQSLPQAGVPDLWVQIMSYDPDRARYGIQLIRGKDRTWRRQPAEGEDEFRARVAAEAPGPYPRLLICTFGDDAPSGLSREGPCVI